MKKINFFDDILSKIEETILSYSVLVMAVVLVGNVISRSVFNKSWTFAEEIGQSLVIVMTFVGIAYGAKKARHISMSAVFDLLPDRVQKIFMIIISSFTSIVMFYLSYLAAKYTFRVYSLGRVTPALRIPIYMIYAIVPLGFFLGGIQYFRNLVINIKEKEVYLSTEKKSRTSDDSQDETVIDSVL